MANRNTTGLFFKVSGFTQDEVDKIINKTTRVKRALEKIKARKKRERRLSNYITIAYQKLRPERLNKPRPNKHLKVRAQIDRGFKVAKRLMRDDI